MSDLAALSDKLAALVEGAAPSVVRVAAGRRTPVSGVAWAEDAVVTVDHAIEDEDGIEVTAADGRTYPARVAGRAPAIDLAVLKIEERALRAAHWHDAAGLRVGHLVVAVARPGRSARAALGIVGAVGETWRPQAGCKVDRYLEADLALRPGFSGGPLVDAAGRVVAVATAGLVQGRAIGIPTETVRRTVSALLARGCMQRAYLGVGTQPVALPRALAAAIGQEAGLIVLAVEPGSPAEKGGVLIGDVLVALDGRSVRHVGDLFEALDEERIGAEATARLLRGGQIAEVKIRIGSKG